MKILIPLTFISLLLLTTACNNLKDDWNRMPDKMKAK
jgi:hypothetical protein